MTNKEKFREYIDSLTYAQLLSKLFEPSSCLGGDIPCGRCLFYRFCNKLEERSTEQAAEAWLDEEYEE